VSLVDVDSEWGAFEPPHSQQIPWLLFDATYSPVSCEWTWTVWKFDEAVWVYSCLVSWPNHS
jgi:hypothetical protein